LGFMLYFKVFLEIYSNYRKVKKNITVTSDLIKMQKTYIMILLFVPFFTSLGGQMYAITFRMIIFIYLGANLGSLIRVSKQLNK